MLLTLATLDHCKTLPKIVLHDHLDGGLRASTIHEIMQTKGHSVPWSNLKPNEWFAENANKKSLPAYLEGFNYTIACMQSSEHLERIAYEAGIDLAHDNVQYAELRFAPLLHTREGLQPDAVVDAVIRGFKRAQSEAHSNIRIQTILCGMRHNTPTDSERMVALAKQFHGHGVCGVDLAGPEEGFLPTLHQKAFKQAAEYGIPITIHAGEVSGLHSIQSAIKDTHANRLGHGVRVLDGVQASGAFDNIIWDILEQNITLEVCPTSNVQTGVCTDLAQHPWRALEQLGLPITLNTDNRLMGNTTTSEEWFNCAQTFDFTVQDLHTYTQTAINGTFLDAQHKNELNIVLQEWTANVVQPSESLLSNDAQMA